MARKPSTPSARPAQPARRASALRATPVAVACATLLLPAASAWAQAADQTVVVTGIRHAIETSIAVKRNSDSIVEAITSEDLGKLPDNSIAESLARLPGLTAQRLNGAASAISIRGMSPKWGVTLLNGREVVSTGDGRSVELDQFPAELVNGATVYKTPDATLGTQGLSGTVNMMTVRPLDIAGRQVSVNARLEKNSNSEQIPGFSSTGNRFSVSYVDQFADRTVGVALGYAHLDNPEQQQHYSNWWWTNMARYPGDWCGGAPTSQACATPGVATDAVALQGFEATAFASKQVRDGLMAVVEFRPNKNVRTTLDLFYSKFSKKFQGREFQEDGFNTWSGTTITNAVYENWDGEKVLVGGTATGLAAKFLTRANHRDDKTTVIGLNNEMKLGDGWVTNADLSYSKVKRDETTAEAYAFPSNTGSLTFRINRDGPSQFTPSLNWADPNIMQLQQAWGQWASERDFTVNDELKGLKLGVKKDLSWGPVNRVEGGLYYADRSKDYQQVKTAYDRRDGLTTGMAFPSGLLGAPANLGFGSIPAVVNFNVQDLLATGLFVGRQDDINSSPNRTWGVSEKVTTAFVKAGLEFKLGGVDVRGNAGLQLIHTQQQGSGVTLQNGTLTPISGSHSYNDVLPSLNLVADLSSNAMLRFGLGRQMARPNMEDMRAGFGNISRSNTNLGLWSADGGNYTLEPWRANAADLSFEYYLAKRSYVSVAAFYKQVLTTIYSGKVVTNFPSYLTDPCVPQTGGTCPSNPTRLGTINAKFNGDGGWVKGTEFSAALDAGRFVPALDGFGVIGSVSFTKSNIHEGNNQSNPMEGMSGTVGSIVAYYEKNGFQTRVAQRTRSRYLASVRNIWGDSTLTTIEPERIVDFQIGYSWEQGPLKGVSVLFQINNATNEPYKTMMGASDGTGTVPNANYLGVYDRYGRQYLLGVGYKF